MDKPTLPPIRNLEELKAARRGVRARVAREETLLKDRLQELPGQLFYLGVRHVLPPVLAGRLTDKALDAGKALVDFFFVKRDGAAGKETWSKSFTRVGILTVLRLSVRYLTKFI